MSKTKEKIMELLKPGLDNIENTYLRIKDDYTIGRDRRRMNRAIREANKRTEATRKTHYVMKDAGGRPFVANRTEILLLQKAGLFKKKETFTIEDLLNNALYIARGRNGEARQQEKKSKKDK